ncbi:MAG: NUDIX domain-containing protein [Burkholderiales bacterium]|nr:NUDIX domain-containing protein [Burkholderiales bacterium]
MTPDRTAAEAPMLPRARFLEIVRHTPLVSVDLVLVRGGAELLLGLRANRPAQGTWFVPGGRVAKGETLAAAVRRVARRELGLDGGAAGASAARFLGVYEHFYPDNFADEAGTSTHYVVVAHRIDVPAGFAVAAADAQHEDVRWWPLAQAASSPAVHENSRVYARQLAAPAAG